MIDPEHDLAIKHQAQVLGISRSTVYYEPRPISDEDLWLMRRIDELHLNYPFAGSRMLRGLLWQQGLEVGRRHIKTLMKRMGIEAIYRRPQHLETRARTQDLSVSSARSGRHAAQPGLGHGHHLHPHGARLRLSGGGGGLVQQKGSCLAMVDNNGCQFLHRGAGRSPFQE
jgi:hypothetical protein